jgi:hypothetical protein
VSEETVRRLFSQSNAMFKTIQEVVRTQKVIMAATTAPPPPAPAPASAPASASTSPKPALKPVVPAFAGLRPFVSLEGVTPVAMYCVFCRCELVKQQMANGQTRLSRTYALVQEHGAIVPRSDEQASPVELSLTRAIAYTCAGCVDVARRLEEFNLAIRNSASSYAHLFTVPGSMSSPSTTDVCAYCSKGWQRVQGLAIDCIPVFVSTIRTMHMKLCSLPSLPFTGKSSTPVGCVHHSCWSRAARPSASPSSPSPSPSSSSSPMAMSLANFKSNSKSKPKPVAVVSSPSKPIDVKSAIDHLDSMFSKL